MVEVVGARPLGQASGAAGMVRQTSAARPSVLPAYAVMAISGMAKRLAKATTGASSAVSPDQEMASRTSPLCTMPRSPWLASAECTNDAGSPVDASVAAIFRPTSPDLPTPVTMTRPRAAEIVFTASENAAPSAPSPVVRIACSSASRP